jgi:hypothetical protein
MPTPQLRPGFVDRALANATGVATRGSSRGTLADRTRWRHVALRWETWLGAVVGGAVAAALTVVLMQPVKPHPGEETITMALNEARDIDVLIESDRNLPDATIRIAVTGGVALDGFANEHIVDWRTDLGRGPNLLSLPVIARKAGDGQLVAVIEHGGRTRTVMINLTVSDSAAKRS